LTRQKSNKKLMVQITYCPVNDANDRFSRAIGLLISQHKKMTNKNETSRTEVNPAVEQGKEY